MRAAFEKYNGIDPEIRKQCAVLSMDVKDLHPSMEWEEIAIAVREMVENSKEEIENVNYHEVGKYLAVTLSREEIYNEGLQHVIPKRKVETNREISVAYLCNNEMKTNGNMLELPGSDKRRKC